MPNRPAAQQLLLAENEDLRFRLALAEEALREMRSGEVDALFVSGAGGAQLFTGEGADRSFRMLIEGMREGALTVTADGVVVYANGGFARMVKAPLEKVIGSAVGAWLASGSQPIFQSLLEKGAGEERRAELVLAASDGTGVPVHLSVSNLPIEGWPDAYCLVATDLTEHKRNEAIAASERVARELLVAANQSRGELLRVIEDKKRAVEQLQVAVMSTVKVATTLSEMRDPYTAGHERRVAEIAVAIGAELGFDARRLEGLRVAGHLHDVGKITIPSEILSKPGKISAVEFMLIQGHPQAGYDVLKDVEFPWPVAQVALQHHERIDGSGYPQGLKGEAILLEARIMAVADVVEAMSSHRPYRAGLGIDKALAEIERGRGSAYDTAIADACLKLFREKGYAIPA